MNDQQALRSLAALRRERPQWLPVLQAALSVAERLADYGGEFAGAWVLDELQERSGRAVWLPNLRVLLTYGFLEKAGESSRGGRRAYYRLSNAEAIRKAFVHLKQENEAAKPSSTERRPGKFRFIGAGDSGKAGSDTARKAGETSYEPRTWR